MSAASEKDVLSALRAVRDPLRQADIVSLDMIRGLQISNGHVLFSLEVDPARGPALEPLRQEAERVVTSIKGVKKATVVLTAEKRAQAHDPHGMEKNPPLALPVKKIIAVASGKGGVGKSTVAFNLAVAIARRGMKTGLLDADIYGPSVPRLAGLAAGQKPDMKEGQLQPREAHGLKLMSMGFMVAEEKAMIWRGPMVQTALYQMLRDVAWGTAENPLDFLIVDMPPGTGDAHLTLAQKVSVAGAIIVSTPQDLALIDARKAIEMFRATNVPILGLIENMSTYVCASCGHEEHIFGHGGAAQEADKQNVPFLGAIPLNTSIRTAADSGLPVRGDFAKAYDLIAEKILTAAGKTET